MSATTLRPLDTRGAVALGVLAADLLALLLAGAYALWTFQELATNPDADPLTGLGYLLAIVLAAPAATSLLLLAVARRTRGRTGDVLLGVAAVPPVLLGLLVLAGTVAG